MHVDIVFNVRDGILNWFLACFNLSNELLYRLLCHFRHTDQEVCEKLELCLELVIFSNLICRGVNVLSACLN